MPKRHIVQAGDCISSLAVDHGLFYQTIWEDPANAEIKDRRKDPSVLAPGDVVVLPDKRPKQVSIKTGARHVFRRRGVPALFRLRLTRGEEPRAGLVFLLEVDGRRFEGRTDDQGRLEQAIPSNARTAKLTLRDGEAEEVYEILLGHLEPVSLPGGALARLHALGFHAGPLGAWTDADLEAALSAFQAAHALTANGRLDAATADKLVAAFGA